MPASMSHSIIDTFQRIFIFIGFSLAFHVLLLNEKVKKIRFSGWDLTVFDFCYDGDNGKIAAVG